MHLAVCPCIEVVHHAYAMWWVVQKMEHNLLVFAVVLGALFALAVLSYIVF